jgi:hypothetical protein
MYHAKIYNIGFGAIFILTCIQLGCLNAPDLDDTPEITAITLSKNTMVQGNLNNDSLVLVIEFTDGDGNFGSDKSPNIFIKDSRRENLIYEYKAPFVPEEGTNNGIKGKIFVTFYTICCISDTNASCCVDLFGCPAQNQLSFDVTVKDRSDNTSNVFTTEDIFLTCL